MMVAAFDIGVHMGWGQWLQGMARSGVKEFPKTPTVGERLASVTDWLQGSFRQHRQDGLLVYEAPLIAKRDPSTHAMLLYGMASRVEEVAWRAGFRAQPVWFSTLKKWATGDGAASKLDMVAAACGLGRLRSDLAAPAHDFMERWNAWTAEKRPSQKRAEDAPLTHEADALLLLAYGLEGFPSEPWARGQQMKMEAM